MGIYYVVDRVCYADDRDQSDPTDHLEPNGDGGYTVASSTLAWKRFLTVFKDFTPAEGYFNRMVGPTQEDIVRLWQVSSWTQKGAAKRCMRSQGQVVKIARADDLEKRRKDRVIGTVMLDLLERSNLSTNNIGKAIDALEKILDKKI
jgi:hypothetical protein